VQSSIIKAALDALQRVTPLREPTPRHLITGARGEELAHFYLRDQGYTIVARNWRVTGAKGELDLIAWERDTLCFVEVKTRTTRDIKPAEAAVDEEKRKHLRQTARRYLRRLKSHPTCRFDIVSMYLGPDGRAEEVTLFRNAFPWRSI
jgi:putative endonuclease